MTKRTDGRPRIGPRLRRDPLRRLLVLATLTAACASDSTAPAVVASVQVTPPNAQTPIGGTVQLVATPRDASGRNLSGRTITWSSANPAVATVDGSGMVTGASLGAVQITATSEGKSGWTSVTVLPGPAAQLVFTAQPGTVAAGAPFAPAIEVTARDDFGNTATGFTGPVTLALGSNPGGGALAGTTTVAAVAGVATFPGVSVGKTGVGYTLLATATGLPAAASAPFTVTPAPATQLAFTVQPAPTEAGAVIAPALQVTAHDAFGNTATAFAGAVTIAIANNPAGGTLSGPTTVAAVAGVAMFGELHIDKAGSGYTLSASATGLTSATSPAFDVLPGAPHHLAFVVPPATMAAGAPFTPAVQVEIRDSLENRVTTATHAVTLAIATNPAGGVLSGTTTQAAAAGIATFPGLSIDKASSGYTLTAAAGGLGGATSPPFAITAGGVSATQSSVVAAPATIGASSGNEQSTITVTARDAFGNPVPGLPVVLAATGGGNTLTQPALTDASGVATGTLSSTAAGGKSVSATVSGVAVNQTASVTVNAAPAASLAFTVQPSTTGAGASITPAVQVTARDPFGNTATTFNGGVTVAIGTNPGGGALSGTTAVAAVAGVATFSDLSINRTGLGYTLTAAAPGLTDATSNEFTIVIGELGPLAFTGQPSTTAAGAPVTPAIQVTTQDAFGNTASGFTGTVCVAIGTNPSGTGMLSGTTCRTAVAGIATFSDLSIDHAGAGYTLVATAPGLPGATSAAFTVTAGTATTIALLSGDAQTDTIGATLAAPYAARVTDAFGNGVSGVTVAWAVTGGGGAITPNSVTDVTGQAHATRVLGNTAGAQTATATVSGLSGSPVAFAATATPGSPAQLAFTEQPSTTAAGGTITPAVLITARDRMGTTTTAFAGSVAVAIGTNPAGGALSGIVTIPAVAGVAAFSNLSIDKAGTGYTLTAAAAGLTGATSDAFDVTAGIAAAITLLSGDAQTDTVGATLTAPFVVRVTDSFGNGVAGVTVAWAATGGGGSITPSSTTDAAGEAQATRVLGTTAGPQSATASVDALTGSPVSFTTTATPGITAHLAFTVQPSDAVAGEAITPAVEVTARDGFGNTATGFTGIVTVAIGTNAAGNGVLDGTKSVAATAGVASFPGLDIDEAGAGYTLTAGATGLSGDTSAPFTIAVGAAANLALVSGDAQADTVGATLAAPYVVRVTDTVGNGVSGVTVTWAVTGGGGTITPSSITSVTGEAQATRLLGTTAGPHGATASVAGLAGSPVSFTATASAGTTTQLAFTAQPSTAGAGAVITPAVQIAARDGHGNTATSFTGTVTVAIGANPGGGTLSGTTAVAAVGGIATFSTLSIDNVGTGYTLTATSAGLATATSAAFDVLTGISATLSTVAAATDTVGQCLRSCQLGLDASRITVTVRDVGGNPVAGVPVALAATSPDSVLFTNPGASGVTDANGVFAADFRSGQAVTKVVTAVAGGTSLSQAPTVHVMPVLVGAGDIATCTVLSDDAVADLLDSIPGTVFTLGDNAYEHGTATEFANCYHPTWGRHLTRTRAVAGNRDYDTPGATGHYGYFGAAANPSGGTGNDAGFYSFDLGAWHIIALNTEVATASNSAQMAWLLQDLNGRRDQCVIAMWHKPMFGSSSAGSGSAVPLWTASADSSVDIVLNGHAHIYERLVPLDATGNPSATGVRTFIVGTGGISLGGFSTDPPYTAVRDKTTHGVLRIVLYPGRYRWQFIPAPGFGTFTDSGTAACS